MQLSSIRVLGICLAIGLAIGVVLGIIYALAADKVVAYGIGTALLVIGLIALALGLLGATEPPDGWSFRRRVPGDETSRRSLVARVAYENPNVDNRVSSSSLAVWGLVVGGGLIVIAALSFSLAQ
jgi:hypothetical protein